jgi:hypothetical protein
MRINLIGNFKSGTGLTQDAMILRGMLTHKYGESVQIRKIHHVFPQCPEAEMNIFIEIINPCLFSYALKNVWIPNPEWTYNAWLPYFNMVDEVWSKTKHGVDIMTPYCPNVKYIGWTSIDKVFQPKKNYHKAIVLVGKNVYRNPKPVIQAYLKIKTSNPNLYSLLPSLSIPYDPNAISFHYPPGLDDKITILDKVLTESEYDSLLNECGLAICTSAAEGFGHAVNEAMSSGCNLIVSNIPPFMELTNYRGIFLNTGEKTKHPSCLGDIVDVSVHDLMVKLSDYVYLNLEYKKSVSLQNREIYENHHADFLKQMPEVLEEPVKEYNLTESLPKEEELPNVSIITLTYNRRIFMPLANYSYMIQSYPEDKLEWVIVDDGEESIEDTLIGIKNVKYIRLDQKTSIGQKRNIGIEAAMYDMLVMMDDDDVYPNNSILHRVAMLHKSPKVECVFCTTIPCYDIQKHISFINVPPYTLPMSERVSEASLAFTREFWNDKKFNDIQIAEGNAFIHDRERKCREISPQEVIVSLVHSGNTSSRKVPEGEPNGCHYGFNEELFTVVSLIGDSLNTSCQKESGGESCVTSGDDLPLKEGTESQK